MADFSAKLNKLQVVEGPPRADLTKLTSSEGYPILAARFHCHAKYGTSVIIDVNVDGEPKVAFLPKRFARSLNQEEVDLLASGGYRIKCTGITNKSPDIVIFKL